jgi:hypothetical protein
LRFRDETFEVGEWRNGVFFISAKILERNINMIWYFMLVYDSANHGRTEEFLGELEGAVAECQVLLVIAGDFNLIRFAGIRATTTLLGLGCGDLMNPLLPWRCGRSSGQGPGLLGPIDN